MTPPGLIICTFLFWGYCTSYLSLALALGLVIELAKWVPLRYEFTDQQVAKSTDFSILAFAVLFYFYFNQPDVSLKESRQAFIWLPIVFTPLILMQSYGEKTSFDPRLFFILTRKAALQQGQNVKSKVHLNWIYFIMILLAACIANHRFPYFYPILGLLILTGLYSYRSRRVGLFQWGALAGLVLTLGYFGHVGLVKGQAYLYEKTSDWIKHRYRISGVSHAQATAIGEIGEIQKSSSIMVRLEGKNMKPTGTYLKMASYDTLVNDYSWMSLDLYQKQKYFSNISLSTGSSTDMSCSMWVYTPGGTGYLPLPPKAVQVDKLNASKLQRPPLGGLRSFDGPEWLSYQAVLGHKPPDEKAPSDKDLQIPEVHQNLVDDISQEWFGEHTSAADIVKALQQRFSRFEYSLKLHPTPPGLSSLENFLLKTQSGHCEYFATCTVLLLRKMGIHARYTIGYTMDEYSSLEKAWISRGSDAHAWVRMWNGKQWINVDTTPGGPPQLDFTAPVRDFFSWLQFKFSRWRFSKENEDQLVNILPYIILGLVLYIVWRLRSVKRKKTRIQRKGTNKNENNDPFSVKFRAFHETLEKRDLEKQPWEGLNHWTRRVTRQANEIDLDLEKFTRLTTFYDRYLYDNTSVTEEEKREVDASLSDWLKASK